MQRCERCGASWENNIVLNNCPFCNAKICDNKDITTVEEAFEVIIQNHGKEVFMENVILLGLLSDYAPKVSDERRLVKFAIESGAYKAILQSKDEDINVVICKYASIMQRKYYIEYEWAEKSLMWFVRALRHNDKDNYFGNQEKITMEHKDILGNFEVHKQIDKANKIIDGFDDLDVSLATNYTDFYNTDNIDDLDEEVNKILAEIDLLDSGFEMDGNVLIKYRGENKIIQIPDGIYKISKAAFLCEDIIKIIFPSSVKVIDDFAFRFCSNLEEVVFLDGLVSIGDCAFDGCSLLKQINLPDSLENLGIAAFSHCKKLIEIKLPVRLSKIKRSTFYDCDSLEKIIVSKNTVIDREAFSKGKIPTIEYYEE
jgi:hypothetical protein